MDLGAVRTEALGLGDHRYRIIGCQNVGQSREQHRLDKFGRDEVDPARRRFESFDQGGVESRSDRRGSRAPLRRQRQTINAGGDGGLERDRHAELRYFDQRTGTRPLTNGHALLDEIADHLLGEERIASRTRADPPRARSRLRVVASSSVIS